MSADTNLSSLGRVAGKAIAALISRTVALQLVVLGGNVMLTRLLEPRDFGVFAIVQFALGILLFFGDTGLAGALVRQQGEPTEEQLSSMFYFQLAAAIALMLAIVGGAGLMAWIWHDLPASAPLLLRVMGVDLVLVFLRIVPTLLLERQLEFGKLAVIEVVGTMTFYLSAVSLAFAGFGVWALASGVLVQGALTTGAVFLLCPWRPKRILSWEALKPLLRFGIAQQLRNVIGLVNGAVTPLWGGRKLGAVSVGFFNWAQNTAYFPLKLVEILARVGFPLFAKLQHDRALLGESLGRAIHLCAFVTFAWVGLCLGLGEQITLYVFSAKWLPAVPMLLIFAAVISIGFLSPLVAVALDALGKPTIFARLALGWTALNWLAVPIATHYWHTIGFAAGYALHVVVGNIAVAIVLRRLIPETKLWLRLRAPLLGGIAAAALGRLVLAPRVVSSLSFVLSLAAAVAVYAAMVWLIDGRALLRAMSVVPGAAPSDQDALKNAA